MSPIIGTYTNAALGVKLVISEADDSNGMIKGQVSLLGFTSPIQGVWNTSTISPNAVFEFSGGVGSPTYVVGGVGAALDFQTFANTNISISVASKGGVITHVNGLFVRS